MGPAEWLLSLGHPSRRAALPPAVKAELEADEALEADDEDDDEEAAGEDGGYI